MTHVDDFIDSHRSETEEEDYARFFFQLHRFPASQKMDWQDYINEFSLFCTYKGAEYKVTGCSRMGDVWLHSDLSYDGVSYEKRVDVAECSGWGRIPRKGGAQPVHHHPV